ncbi:D-alanine--D-alanine ligase [Blastococcus sp. MG754426]|uniref:D-alanine--D-alanine ligase family protein n=1 Tax=unclassified Blastococcus TaxID=2619396 RepID=UPI001EF11526|nr:MULTISPECIES: D-alanine--D-alanine ligase family protein [unclassified Blastococcus]MCF6505874.1 D-alanine--D-alanine ligase [Blastococcus sp. MG754426]MCF6511046.1 D-alanine--D-alanine ligase [Blastococcus sp. MG754427]MCF6735029.1 D-alanine--D-alanine ligase [Blastococcus sp. KM273129]
MSGQRGRVRVAVVFGGRSEEHAISCISAGSVMAALDPERYEVVPVGIAKDGRWVLPDPGQQLALTGGALPEVTGGTAVSLVGDPEARGLAVLEPGAAVGRALTEVDVVFPVLHGAFGEDGTVQGLLEMTGLPYVGSGVFASAASMDKEFTKKLLAAAGLPQGDHVVLRDEHGAVCADADLLGEAGRERLGLPVFVKPARAGSSIGISKVTDWAQFPAAVAAAAAVDPKVIVEAAVPGREIECGVLAARGPGLPEASLPAEIRLRPGVDWYDFAAKYLDDAAEFDIPADLTPEQLAAVQDTARRAYLALDCRGLARVDFFLSTGPDGADRLVVNEVNTMPGFTPISMFARMWGASGVGFAELVDRLVSGALAGGARPGR